jgi:hypothetical protein
VNRGGRVGGIEPGDDLTFVGREFCAIGDCVEAARLEDGRVALRSSLNPHEPLCLVTATEWAHFLTVVKAGRFDDL